MVSVQGKKPYNLSTNVDAKGKLILNSFPFIFPDPVIKTSILYQHSFGLTKFIAELRKNAVLSDGYNYHVKMINKIAIVVRTFACQLAAIEPQDRDKPSQKNT